MIPELKVWNGPRDVHALSARAQTLVNQLFEDTIGIKRTKLEDDQFGIYSDYVSWRWAGSRRSGRTSRSPTPSLGGGSALVYDNQAVPCRTPSHP